MAELVGTVASGISIAALAVQIAKNVARLKSYWDAIREAPAEISILIEEIETLYLLLEDIKDDHLGSSAPATILDSTGSLKCLELSRKGANALQEVADELSSEICASRGMRQRWASAKFVFRKDKVQQHRLRLERAVRLLSLAYQIYTRDLVRLQPSLVVAQLRGFEITERESPAIRPRDTYLGDSIGLTESSEPPSSQPRKSTKRPCTENKMMHFRIPALVTSSAWEFILAKSQAGWDFRIRTYNIRSRDSPVFLMARKGDVDGLRDLFRRGLASPFDINENGGDYLLQAVIYKQVETCKFLIYQGGYSYQQTNYNGPASLYLTSLMMNMCIGDSTVDTCEAMVDLLTAAEGIDLDSYEILSYFRGSLEAFLHLKGRIQALSGTPTMETCVMVAIALANQGPPNNPDVIRAALPRGKVSPVVAKFHTRRGTLLGGIAFAIGSTVTEQYLRRAHPHLNPNWNEDLYGWRRLLQELLYDGASPSLRPTPRSQFWQWQLSPMLEIFKGALTYIELFQEWNFQKIFSMLPSMWAKELVQGGVDLIEYAQAEEDWQRRNSESKSFLWRKYGHPTICYEFHIYGFASGPSPEDWQVWFSDPTDAYVGEFWNMIEPPEMTMPGMWVD